MPEWHTRKVLVTVELDVTTLGNEPKTAANVASANVFEALDHGLWQGLLGYSTNPRIVDCRLTNP